jgi:hypothetical protein
MQVPEASSHHSCSLGREHRASLAASATNRWRVKIPRRDTSLGRHLVVRLWCYGGMAVDVLIGTLRLVRFLEVSASGAIYHARPLPCRYVSIVASPLCLRPCSVLADQTSSGVLLLVVKRLLNLQYTTTHTHTHTHTILSNSTTKWRTLAGPSTIFYCWIRTPQRKHPRA